MRGGLEKLRSELVGAGASHQAGNLARILQTTALKAVAEYTRRMSTFFVQTVPTSFNREEKADRERRINDLADKIDLLASAENSSYSQFEEILQQLRVLGFFPDTALVSDVARAFYGRRFVDDRH